jgi:hypothetical protein
VLLIGVALLEKARALEKASVLVPFYSYYYKNKNKNPEEPLIKVKRLPF